MVHPGTVNNGLSLLDQGMRLQASLLLYAGSNQTLPNLALPVGKLGKQYRYFWAATAPWLY